MDKEERDYSMQSALRFEFDSIKNETRLKEILQTAKELKFDVLAEEMENDLIIEEII